MMRARSIWLVLASQLSIGCGSAASEDYDIPAEPSQEALRTIPAKLSTVVGEYDYAVLAWVARDRGVQIFQRIERNTGTAAGNLVLTIRNPPPIKARTSGALEAEVLMIAGEAGQSLPIEIDPGSGVRVTGRVQGTRLVWDDEDFAAQTIAPNGAGMERAGQPSERPAEKKSPLCRKDCSDKGAGGTCVTSCDDAAAEDPLNFVISNDPYNQRYTCRGFLGTDPEHPDGWRDLGLSKNPAEVEKKICRAACCNASSPECAMDLPPPERTDVQIHCSEDEKTFQWTACAPDYDLCGTNFCHFGKGVRDFSAEHPEGYPPCSVP